MKYYRWYRITNSCETPRVFRLRNDHVLIKHVDHKSSCRVIIPIHFKILFKEEDLILEVK